MWASANPPTPTPPPPPSAAPPVTAPPAALAVKAKPGELRATVAGILAADPATEFSVTDLVGTLGNSGGAIGNACETLVARGEAEKVGTSPRRYKANANTSAAAVKPVITAPGQGVPPRAPRPAGSASTTPSTTPTTPASTTPPAAVPPPPAARTAGGKIGPIRRPNGAMYYPRALAPGVSDVEALRKLRDAGIPALLYGPPGTGKTSMAEAAFEDLITVAGDGDTTVGDLIGDWTQKDDGGYEFKYGPVIEAMLEGRALLIDDATLISPKVLAAMYPAMDGRKQITVKAHKGEIITAEDGFYVIAGHNPGVHGAILTDALSSRFSTQIHVETDYDLCRQLKIDSKAVTIARNLAKLVVSGEIGWAPQLRELIAFQKIADTIGLEVAFANLIGIAPAEDRDQVAEVVNKAAGQKVTALALGKQI
ncbi:AAA family ATPase [Catenulispora yoronensis]|uniref:AAA family ATPase n=1 Tax=Catenulispora yoronensis TaxID=450799 RepID=UPI003CD091B6